MELISDQTCKSRFSLIFRSEHRNDLNIAISNANYSDATRPNPPLVRA